MFCKCKKWKNGNGGSIIYVRLSENFSWIYGFPQKHIRVWTLAISLFRFIIESEENRERCIFGQQRISEIHSSYLTLKTSNGTTNEWKKTNNVNHQQNKNCWKTTTTTRLLTLPKLEREVQLPYAMSFYWFFLAVTVVSAAAVTLLPLLTFFSFTIV